MAFTKIGTLSAGDVVTAAGINAGAVGWTTYSPTLTNIAVGNGTQVAKYGMFGRVYFLKWQLTLGSTSTVTGLPTISLPVSAADAIELNLHAAAGFFDLSASTTYIAGMGATTTAVMLYALNASATYTTLTAASSTVPFTWATGDIMRLTATYEGAS